MIYTANLIVMFFVELAMLAIFAFYGYEIGDTTILRIVYAVLLPTLALVIWRVWAAPKAKRQLKMPYLVLFRMGLFLVAAYLLYHLGQKTQAIVFASIAMITQIISLIGGKSQDAESLEKQFLNRR